MTQLASKHLASFAVIALSLAGCHRGASSSAAPTGQVVANVGGKEVTASELQMELSAQPDAALAKQQQPAALQAIINRKLLAQAAIDQGLDKSPLAAMMMAKARDLALVSLLQQSIESKAPKVTPEEAGNFVRDNPTSFSQRRLIAVDQLLIPQASPALVKQLEPLNTMESITALLDAQKIAYRKGNNAMDPLMMDPSAAKQIAQMNVGDVFVTPAEGGAVVSRIRETSMQPQIGRAHV